MRLGWAKNLGRAVLDMLLPPQCLACDQGVEVQGQLCASCFRQIGFVTAPFCPLCAVPLVYGGQAVNGVCPRCAEMPPAWDRARAALRYDAQSRRLILPLKHADRTDLAAPLAAMMLRAGGDLLKDAELLVPVPLHPSRLRARRYNQAALLARAVGRLAGIPVAVDALVRLRATSPLGELSAAQRATTVAQAFAPRRAASARLAGKRVVLIDDVLTSGATATGCTLALRAAEAVSVDVLVAARVPDPRLK
jgi:predicted amidophosphoribosyltransferase